MDLKNFRIKPIGLPGDIEKAFLQIGIKNEHQIYIWYLWEENNKLEIYQMIRLPFGLSCSPVILLQAIQTLISESKNDYPQAKA